MTKLHQHHLHRQCLVHQHHRHGRSHGGSFGGRHTCAARGSGGQKHNPHAEDRREPSTHLHRRRHRGRVWGEPARCCQESASHFRSIPRSGAKLAPLKIPWQGPAGHNGDKRQGHRRNHHATSWSASGPFTARDTTLRGPGRGLGGPVGSSWGFPLLLLILGDTSLRGLGCGLAGPVGSILGVPLLLL